MTLSSPPLQEVEPPSAEFQVHPRVESRGLETSRHQVQPTADGLKAVTEITIHTSSRWLDL